MTKKNLFLGVISILLGFCLVFVVGCKTDADDDESNPFVGVWTKDDSGGTVKVTITNTEWAAKVSGVLYNRGTYTPDNPSTWKVTEIGSFGSAILNDTGIATIANGKMTVASFLDANMNGTYSK
jgi:hypothetical protein